MVGSPQAATPTERDDVKCEGFRWVGQSWRSCDGCGRPAWEHVGMEVYDDVFAFGGAPARVEPWAEGRWDLVVAAWQANAVWEKQERYERRWDGVTVTVKGERQYGVDFPAGGEWRETSRVAAS